MFLKMLAIVSSLAGMIAASAAPPLPPPAVPSIPNNGSLRVTVKLLKPQVRVGHSCPVEMDVANISSRPQTLYTYGCSWGELWSISDRRLFFQGGSGPCHWNPLRVITLKPGEQFRQDAALETDAKPGNIRFRVTFYPGKGRSFESDTLTLKVTS